MTTTEQRRAAERDPRYATELRLEVVEPYTPDAAILPGEATAPGVWEDPSSAEVFYLLNATTKGAT